MYGIVKLSQMGTMVSDPSQSKVIVGDNEVIVLLNDKITSCIKSGVLTLVKELTDEEFAELTTPVVTEAPVANILDVDAGEKNAALDEAPVVTEAPVEEVVAPKPILGSKRGSNS